MTDSPQDEPMMHHDYDEGDNSVLQNDDPDTLRILLSTDNHLGYAERDPIRGLDSFCAFEEVLYLARRFHCDMVLIAGDLFHDNRPSRRTLYKTMEILRRYCMGPDPVPVQILSSADITSSSSSHKTLRSSVSGVANYLDPNYAVHLPVFSIHGNHDDPSRDQGGGELLAPLGTCNAR
jgi:double-strand break repair protein MRE11